MQRRWWLGPLALALAASVAASPQAPAFDAERLLADRFGFTPAEIAQVRAGTPVAKLLPSSDSSDVGVLSAVRIATDPARLVAWLRDIAAFRKAAELGPSRRLSDPPVIDDFAGLTLDADHIDALRTCRAGNCDLRLGDRAIARFQSEVDWTSAGAGRDATALTRQLLLERAQAYLAGGDETLGAYHDEKTPRAAADEFARLVASAGAFHDLAPPLTAYLRGFPSAGLPDSEQFLYWAVGGVGPDASVTLHQLITYRPPGGAVMVVDKQLYASRYVDAALAVVTIVPDRTGQAFHALVGARARSTALSGLMARVLRSQVERTARDTAAMYLGWIRGSLMMRQVP